VLASDGHIKDAAASSALVASHRLFSHTQHPQTQTRTLHLKPCDRCHDGHVLASSAPRRCCTDQLPSKKTSRFLVTTAASLAKHNHNHNAISWVLSTTPFPNTLHHTIWLLVPCPRTSSPRLLRSLIAVASPHVTTENHSPMW
jgi:hypothetical protein